MKFFHLADLHIGKTVNGFSLLEDQRVIFDQILSHVAAEKPAAVVIAGDVYDRSQPAAEAVGLYDAFLSRLHETGAAALLVAGNHDSPERLGCAGRILSGQGVHIAALPASAPQVVRLGGPGEEIEFHLLPYIRPAAVRALFPEREIESHEAAVAAVLAGAPPKAGCPRVLVAHQFVTAGGSAPERSDSETLSLGGADAVDVSLFGGYDYVALGHIHKPQRIGRDTARYAGSPLKYSFSERNHKKSLTQVEIGQNGEVTVTPLVLRPRRDMRQITGPLAEVMAEGRRAPSEDYLRVVLTDEQELPDAIGRLRGVYPHVMELDYDNTRSRSEAHLEAGPVLDGRGPEALFVDFYTEQNGAPPDAAQLEIIRGLLAAEGEDA